MFFLRHREEFKRPAICVSYETTYFRGYHFRCYVPPLFPRKPYLRIVAGSGYLVCCLVYGSIIPPHQARTSLMEHASSTGTANTTVTNASPTRHTISSIRSTSPDYPRATARNTPPYAIAAITASSYSPLVLGADGLADFMMVKAKTSTSKDPDKARMVTGVGLFPLVIPPKSCTTLESMSCTPPPMDGGSGTGRDSASLKPPCS